MTDIEVGKVYTGKVKKIMDYGAFVNIMPGKDGLVHISQIKEERVIPFIYFRRPVGDMSQIQTIFLY
mgnify:CR=1 FL=1